jgi:transposase-like protein
MPVISFKVAPAEAEAIRTAARRLGLTVSAYLRRRALPEGSGRGPGAAMQLKPGRVVVAGASDAPVINSEDVAAALYG